MQDLSFPRISGVYEHIRHDKSASSSSAAASGVHPKFAMSELGGGNVTAFLGQTAHLHCAVRDIGDRTVSTRIEIERLCGK